MSFERNTERRGSHNLTTPWLVHDQDRRSRRVPSCFLVKLTTTILAN